MKKQRRGKRFILTRASELHGFTLIELLVVIAIIVVITGAVLANNAKFGGRVTLENLAYDIALTLRQTQQYGIATSRSRSGSFKTGFGMHFNANSASYAVFSDSTRSDGMYSAGEDIPPSPYVIAQGYKVNKLCITPSLGGETCGYSQVDVLFIRPEPDACIGDGSNPSAALDGNGSEYCISTNLRVRIEVLSPRGDTMDVVIENNGQIGVQ